MNPKTKRRLSILLAAAVAGSCALGGLVVYRKHRAAAYYANLRKVGLADYAANDYRGALDNLASYIRRNPADSEALYACAQARLHIEEPNHAELRAAIGVLRSFVDLNPDRKDAREQLLDLYLKVGYFTETLDTAKQILDRSPGDANALGARARAQFYLRKYDEAYKTAVEYNKVAPLDLEGQSLTLAIMLRRGSSPEDIVARANELLASHPDDSRFELVKSTGYAITGDIPSARTWAQKAAKHPNPDPAFLKLLIRHLDTLSLFAEANSLQENAARNSPDPQTRDSWIARLLQSARYDEVVDVVSKERDLDTNLLVYKTLALIHLDRTADAESTLAVLAERGKSDVHAAAAANAIDRTLLHPNDPAVAVSACNDALVADNQDPFFLFMLAKAYNLSGEGELAEEHYQQAANAAPAWAEPLTAKSKLFLSQGRVLDAFVAAQQARNCSPDDREALVYTATSGVYLIPADRADKFKELLQLIQKIQDKYPDEQRVLPARVMALSCLNQKSEALDIFKMALAPDFRAVPDTLLALAAASMKANLGEEDACFTRYQQLHGTTPEVAFARAAWLASKGRGDDGLKYLDEAQAQQTSASSTWKINHARYLDLTNNPQAKKEWESLAESNPKDVNIQWLALAARSTQNDRDFMGRTIDRLRNLRGDKSTFLSITRARYILEGDPSDKDLAEAILLLSGINRENPRIAMAHVLMASAYEHQKNLPGAAEELAIAADLSPDSPQISLSLARILHEQFDFTRARTYINRVAQNLNAATEDRRSCAKLLTEEGDFAAAIDQFEKIAPSDRSISDKMSLALLYRQRNDTAKLEPLLQDILKHPTAESVQFAAELYGSQNRKTDARHAITLLDSIQCPPAVRARIEASYQARFGSLDNAIEGFKQAIKESPKDPGPWRQLIGFCILTNRQDDVQRFAVEAHSAFPDDSCFEAFTKNLAVWQKGSDDAALRPIFVSVLNSPADAAKIFEAVQLFLQVETDPVSADASLAKLRQNVANSPSILSMQLLGARACLIGGRRDDAIDIASRAMQNFPTSPDAARMTTESLAAAGRWSEVLTTAQQWRSRIQGSPIEPDQAIADAYMQLGKTVDGLHQLEPYISQCLQTPDRYVPLIYLYTQGLIATNQIPAAAKLLNPLLSSQQWRLAWIDIASRLPVEKDSADWLEKVSTAIPESAISEELALAIAYRQVAVRTHNPMYLQRAVLIADRLSARADCTADILFGIATIYEASNNLAAAEQGYRRSLQLKPDQPIVMNNLAMVLVNRGSDSDEALKLISQAIALNPKVPNFFDTQASVFAQKKSFDRALDSIASAIKLAPSDPEWQATRIWLLTQAGKRNTADAEFRQLKSGQQLSKVSESAQKRLSDLGLQ